jgi:hypothetical protein
MSDAAHCGNCSTVCAFTNALAICNNGACAMALCSSGFADCDASPSNGCEVNLNSDVNDCGTCGYKCPTTGGTPACTNGVCGYNNCSTGYATCPPGGACATHTTADIDNCGGCGTHCSYSNASSSCQSSVCVLGGCASGYGNCDGSAANGCEVNLLSNAENCNACGAKCSSLNAAASCINGACVQGNCISGYADCDSSAANGCEVNLLSDSNNCNTCGAKCGSANATPACHNGTCQLTCDSNYLNCDGKNSNGCEVDGLTDGGNCGTCGHVCPYGCTNGICNAPCTGICSNPNSFTIDSATKCTFGSSAQGACSSPSLGTSAICYQTISTMTGGGCYNFTGGRTLSINGVAQTCSATTTGWPLPLPATLNGGYCISVGTGSFSYATFNVW